MKTFLWFWLIPLTTGAGDGATVDVSCVWNGVCVLPCTSTYHYVIHWYKDGKSNSAHTFYDGADRLQHQEEQFKGRTSLFGDQISRGNVSLLLKDIRTADEGTYKCYTASRSENAQQFVRLSVRAPVKALDLQMLGKEISCSTRDVYPEPKISWFSDGNEEKSFQVKQEGDKEHLFSVSSTLARTAQENITYNCSIGLGDETPRYTASLRREKVEVLSGENVSIRCPVSQETTTTENITLMEGDSSTILIFNQTSQLPTEMEWQGRRLQVARNGTVIIHDLKNSRDTETYRCVRVTEDCRQEVLTEVQIKSEDNQHVSVAIGVSVAAVVIVAMTIIAAVCWKRQRSSGRSTERSTERSSERSTQRSSERSTQRSSERSTQRSTERSSEIISLPTRSKTDQRMDSSENDRNSSNDSNQNNKQLLSEETSNWDEEPDT